MGKQKETSNRERLQRKFLSAFGANTYAQTVTILIQLVSIPWFLAAWSAERYGLWLILSSIPTYLALADGGILGAASNEAALLAARGDKTGSQATTRTVSAVVVLGGVAIILICAATCAVLKGFDILTGEIALTAWILCMLSVFQVFSAIVEMIHRALSRYATGLTISTTQRLLEAIGYMLGAAISNSLVVSAALGFLFRVIGLLLAVCLTLTKEERTALKPSLGELHLLRKLVKPGLGFIAFPIGNAAANQGVTLAIGATLGLSSVTIYNAYRTLSRVIVQGVSLLSNSAMPQITEMFGGGDVRELNSAVSKLQKSIVLLTVVFGGILATIFPALLSHWTNNKISFYPELAYVMIVSAQTAAFWIMWRTALLATNKHSAISAMFLCGSIIHVIATYFVCDATQELVMAAYISLVVEACLAAITRAKYVGIFKPNRTQ